MEGLVIPAVAARRPGTIPVAGPWVTDREVAAVAEAAATAWYDDAGVVVDRFERAFADTVTRRHAISLPSCTAGLHLVLAALGIGPGDEVIVPESTWIATAAPIDYVGATPVFADVDPESWCLSTASVAERITERTRAVIAVDLYGGMPRMEQLVALCHGHGIALIEDAAEAIGSQYHGKPAGAFGVASVFSFHGSKTMTTGEGGMVVTDDDALHRRMQVLRDHGRSPGDVSFRNGEVAFKYKMSALQAAFGEVQLDRLDELVARKRAIFGWYRDRLAGVPGVVLNAEPPGVHNSYWMVTAVLDPALGLSKQALAARLAQRGIATRPFFDPLSSLPAYEARGAAPKPVAAALAATGVNLPSALCLDEDDVATVCDALLDVISGRSR